MTFEEANEKITTCSEDAIKAFGCIYFHNICIKCAHKPQCNRKEPLIKECNFHAGEKTGWQTGIPTKDGLYVIQIHPYGSMNRDPAYACYYIKNGVLKDCIDKDPIEPESFWKDYAIKWMKISY